MAKSTVTTFPMFRGQGDYPIPTVTNTGSDYVYQGPEISTWAIEPETEKTTTEPAQLEAVAVKIAFNRPLTWSEREAFRKFINKKNREHEWQNSSAVVVWDFDLDPSNDESTRKITKDVAAFVERSYLNVHPRSAKSIYPEVIV